MTGDLLVGVAAEQPLRGRIAEVLRRHGIMPVTEASWPDELVRACADRPPHVAVHAWDGAGGAVATRALSTGLTRTRVVVVLPATDRRAVRSALAAGAEGVVIASQMVFTLPVVVQSVWLGQASVPRDAAADLEALPLSHREREVLRLAADGLGNAEIGAKLCVAETTVKRHLSSVFAKLGVHSRTEAIAVAGDRAPGWDHHVPAPAGRTRMINGGQG
jgi:DNA-binding NarL/FixJ family response regulator